MSPWQFLELLITRCAPQCLWFVLLIATVAVLFRSRPFNIPSIIALVSLLSSVAGIAMFTICFLIGGGSNTAQMNSSETMYYWSLWLESFMPLVIALLVSMAVTLLALPFKPYRPGAQLLGRALALATAMQGFYSIALIAPDA